VTAVAWMKRRNGNHGIQDFSKCAELAATMTEHEGVLVGCNTACALYTDAQQPAYHASYTARPPYRSRLSSLSPFPYPLPLNT